jgi:hypothetical protein
LILQLGVGRKIQRDDTNTDDHSFVVKLTFGINNANVAEMKGRQVLYQFLEPNNKQEERIFCSLHFIQAHQDITTLL